MRGLVQAAALLSVPTLASVTSLPGLSSGLEKTVSSTSIALELPGEHHGLSLHLEVEETSHPCGTAPVRINSQPLFQGPTGKGHGFLLLDDGVFVDASWGFTCAENVAQTMTFTVHGVEGETVEDVAFKATVRQTGSIGIDDVKGNRVVSVKHDAAVHGEGDKTAEMSEEERTMGAKRLRTEIRKLRMVIREKQKLIRQIEGVTGKGLSILECDSIQCWRAEVVSRLKESFFRDRWPKSHASGGRVLCRVGPGQERPKFCRPMNGRHHRISSPPHHPGSIHASDPPARHEMPRPAGRHHRHSSELNKADFDMFVTSLMKDEARTAHPFDNTITLLGIGSVIFAFLSFSIMVYISFCTYIAPSSDALTHLRQRQSRRGAARNLLTFLLFHCDKGEDEASKYNEKHIQQQSCTATLADELAEFRQAADIVSDLIAVEEGRAGLRQQSSSSSPPPCPQY